jgi:hypothetical protein
MMGIYSGKENAIVHILYRDALLVKAGSVTVTCSHSLSKGNLDNLLDGSRHSYIRTVDPGTGVDVWVQFDFGASGPYEVIRGWAICNHNTSDCGAATVYFEYSSNGSNWANVGGAYGESEIGNADFFIRNISTPQTRYVRVRWTGVDDELQIGRVYLATQAINVNAPKIPVSRGWKSVTDVNQTLAGYEHRNPRGECPNVFSWLIRNPSMSAVRTETERMILYQGLDAKTLIISDLYGIDIDHVNTMGKAWHVKWNTREWRYDVLQQSQTLIPYEFIEVR